MIAATPGIDALFIGPYDLATALSSGKAQDVTAPEVEQAIDLIGAAANKAGKIPAIYCRDAARALDMKKRGLSSPDRADMLALTFAVKIPRRDLNKVRVAGRKPRAKIDYDPFDV